MNISLLGVPIITIPFQHHTTVQQPLLHCLEQLPQTYIMNEDSISKSDWDTSVKFGNDVQERPYWNILQPHIDQTIKDAMKRVDITDFQYSVPWYQQYQKKDHHGWHRHPFATYNVVYYVELPQDAHPTVLRNPVDVTQMITPNVSEGDIFIFPSCLTHCSPPNPSTQRKTIIAFNIV